MSLKEIRQGEVYWFDFGPEYGSEPAGLRPCVVVQSDTFNSTGIKTTVVCVITSNLDRALAPGNVLLKKGDARLTKPSVVIVSQVFTINKVDLEDRIGRLPHSAIRAVLDGLRMLLEGD